MKKLMTLSIFSLAFLTGCTITVGGGEDPAVYDENGNEYVGLAKDYYELGRDTASKLGEDANNAMDSEEFKAAKETAKDAFEAGVNSIEEYTYS